MNAEMNPYASPVAPAPLEAVSLTALREIVIGWEKLRLIYNGVLLLPGIGTLAFMMAQGELEISGAVFIAFVCAAGANAAFFLGPLAELYFRGIFLRGRPAPLLRKLLLGGGFLVSFGAMGIAALVSMM